MSDLKFHLQGSQTDATASALETFFSETFGENAHRESLHISTVGETEKAVDPIAVAGLVLSIPSALLAAMDLAERLKLKEKVARLIALARRSRPSTARAFGSNGGMRHRWRWTKSNPPM